jgi:hypothetical protein
VFLAHDLAGGGLGANQVAVGTDRVKEPERSTILAGRDEAAYDVLLRRHGPMVMGTCVFLSGRLLEVELGVADAEHIAGLQDVLRDPRPVDEGTAHTAAVRDDEVPLARLDLAMEHRDLRVLQPGMRRVVPTNQQGLPQEQWKETADVAPGGDPELS